MSPRGSRKVRVAIDPVVDGLDVGQAEALCDLLCRDQIVDVNPASHVAHHARASMGLDP